MGLGDRPAALRETTLIMIGCQNTYVRGSCGWKVP